MQLEPGKPQVPVCASAQRVLADPSGCWCPCLCAQGLLHDVLAVSKGRGEQAARGGRLRLDANYYCEVEHVADGIQKETKGWGKPTVVSGLDLHSGLPGG